MSHKIEDKSFTSFIKREIHTRVAEAPFTIKQRGEIDIVVSEILSNIVKHAQRGEILYRINTDPEAGAQFEFISIDYGPGMDDPVRMMKDGMSTTQTLGHGLGAISRLSNFLQLFTIPRWGTILYTRIGDEQVRPVHKPGFINLDLKALMVSKPPEFVCGDGFRVKQDEDHIKLLFADGLGHGEFAKDAVDCAGEAFGLCEEVNPVDILRNIHESVRRTRGLVATVVVVNRRGTEWSFCGVGNILTRLYSGIEYKNYLSYNGTIGLNIPNSMKASVFPIERNQHLIMCSDGIQTRWDLTKYPSIFKYDNTILAAALYKDHSRGTDDSGMLIAKVV